MAKFCSVAILMMLLVPAAVRADDLTLRDVIELRRAGLGEDVLLAVIEADGGAFALSYADIMDLKGEGFSERLIAALVRTGARRRAYSEAAPPVVQVEQYVTSYAPAIVVFGVPLPGPYSSSDFEEGRRRTGGHSRRFEPHRHNPLAATWVTRASDGRNVSADGVVHTGKPAAAWVTPNEIRPGAAGTRGGGSEDHDRGRGSDRDDNRRSATTRDSSRSDSRRPRP